MVSTQVALTTRHGLKNLALPEARKVKIDEDLSARLHWSQGGGRYSCILLDRDPWDTHHFIIL